MIKVSFASESDSNETISEEAIRDEPFQFWRVRYLFNLDRLGRFLQFTH